MTWLTSLGPSADCRGLTQIPIYQVRTSPPAGPLFGFAVWLLAEAGFTGKVARTSHQRTGSGGTVYLQSLRAPHRHPRQDARSRVPVAPHQHACIAATQQAPLSPVPSPRPCVGRCMREDGKRQPAEGRQEGCPEPPPRWNPNLRSGLCPVWAVPAAATGAPCLPRRPGTAMRRGRLAGASFPARAHMGER
jgi:hypothetical protein